MPKKTGFRKTGKPSTQKFHVVSLSLIPGKGLPVTWHVLTCRNARRLGWLSTSVHEWLHPFRRSRRRCISDLALSSGGSGGENSQWYRIQALRSFPNAGENP